MNNVKKGKENWKEQHVDQTPDVKKTPFPILNTQPGRSFQCAGFTKPFVVHQAVKHWMCQSLQWKETIRQQMRVIEVLLKSKNFSAEVVKF